MRIMSAARVLALGVTLCALSVGAGSARATGVTPEGRSFVAERAEAVVFEIDEAHKIRCEVATLNDVVPNRITNPNPGGSVITDVPSTSTTRTTLLSGCVLNELVLSGGGSLVTLSWNDFPFIPEAGRVDIVSVVPEQPGFRFAGRTTCQIVIEPFDAEPIIGRWTNGSPTVSFERQEMQAEGTPACELPRFDVVRFSGRFTVRANPPSGPIVHVEGP
jgi:hypothetical protein